MENAPAVGVSDDPADYLPWDPEREWHDRQADFWQAAFVVLIRTGNHPKDAALKADLATIEFRNRYKVLR